MFYGASWSLIDKIIFYRVIFDFKMFIFNVYKNLFDNCSSFVLLQKMLEFFMVILFDANSSVVSLFLRQKLCVFVSEVPSQLVKIANWFSFKRFV